MRNRVERLRIWLLGSAVFLLLVIAAFLGSARYLRHRLLAKLPAKLGANVKIDSSGVSWCDTVGPITVYCVHAARELEHADGKITLHDVSIAMYGPKGDRADRICGAEFEYDQNSGLVRATGLVHIDVAAATAGGPTGTTGNPAGPAPAPGGCPSQDPASGRKVLHVTTSGLVFMQKLGVAATGEPIEFQLGGMTGHATGADYNSDSGALMLHSAVSMSGVAGGRPVTLTASTAELDNLNHEAFLTHATYESQGQSAQADQATLHSRPDGTLARVEAQGNATGRMNGGTVVSQRADIMLNATSQPESALLTGDVKYVSDGPLRQVRGQAGEAAIAFDAQSKPQPEHALLTGGVHMTERTRATDAAREPWSTRDLTATKFEAALAPAGPGRSQLRDAEATGSAHLTMVSNGSLANSRGGGTTELAADDLKAHLIDTGDAKQPPQLDTIAGRGHTVLRLASVDGVEQTSSGDTLDAKCRPKTGCDGSGSAGVGVAGNASVGKASAGSKAGPDRQIADTLWSAVQQGHVTMMRRAPARSGAGAGAVGAGQEDAEHAIAERAVYDGDQDKVTLSDGVELSDAGSVLWANQVALDRATGDAQATGGVKVDYVQEASSGAGGGHAVAGQAGAARNPTRGGQTATNGASSGAVEATHILADRADLEHATGIATFHGWPVRLWQGGDQVQAPVIEVARAQSRLIARGEASTGWSAAAQAAQVHTVLMRAGSGNAGVAGAGTTGPGTAGSGTSAQCAPAKGGAGKSGVDKAGAAAPGQDLVRIASGGLVYSEILHQAEFTGGFRADTVDSTIRAGEATVYLQPAGGRGQAGGGAGAGTAGKSAASNGQGGAASAAPLLAGNVEHMVATGHVNVEQKGMRATGERLVCTTADQVCMLTGDRSAPPRALDAQGTTLTGAALRFESTCEGGVSVEALGSVSGAPAQRVRTESRVRDAGKKETGKQ